MVPVGVYRPRHPERTASHPLLDRYFPRHVEAYDERFEPRCGPLRPVVPRTVAAFLACGCLKNGFARLRCPSCSGEHLLALSCSTRNFCPSSQAKRSALFAERLQVLSPDDPAQVGHRLYCVTRAPWRVDGARLDAQGRVRLLAPPSPTSGETELVPGPLEWVHAVVAQIPDPGLHLTRSCGAYRHRLRKPWAHLRAGRSASDAARHPSGAAGESDGPRADPPESEFVKKRQASWARLLRSLLEVDPLECPRCGAQVREIAVVTEPSVADRILRHVAEHGGEGVYEQRGPPADTDAVSAGVADGIEERETDAGRPRDRPKTQAERDATRVATGDAPFPRASRGRATRQFGAAIGVLAPLAGSPHPQRALFRP